MSVTRYIQPVEGRAIVYHLGGVTALAGLIMVIPTMVALLATEWRQAGWFAGTGVVFGAVGWMLRRGPERDLSMKEALVVAGLAYLVFALAGTVPLLPHVSPIDAAFESMSGFTTTGLSVVSVARLPTSLLFFRSFSQWIGGGGIIVLSLVVLAGSGLAWTRLYGLEFGEDKLVGSVLNTARLVFFVYATLTVLGFVALLVVGVPAFDALCLALCVLSTGGFVTPYGASLGDSANLAVPLVLTVLMLLGAIGLPLYHLARERGLAVMTRDPQARLLAVFWLAASMLFWFSFNFDLDSLVPSIFHAASTITTTGFSLSEPVSWPESDKLLSIVLMSVGGSAGSTAGGIKLIRFLTALALVRWLLLRRMLPKEARVPLRVGGTVVQGDELIYFFGFIAGYVSVLILVAMVFVFSGYPSIDALFESASAIGTVGLSVGITSPSAPWWIKLLLILEMWIGRLELLPVLVLFYPRTWWKEGDSS